MNLSISIEDIMKQHNEPLPFSGAIYVRDKEETFEQGYGFANRSDRISNTSNTRFGMASGCKIFTAVAISQLVQNGLLAFDTYLKDCVSVPFPHFDDGVTVHHLLTHTSGITDYFDEEVMENFEELWKAIPMYTVQSPKDFLPMFQNGAMKFSPGERFSYNNAGFILLGLIVEHVTGLDFTEYVEKNIFQPCGMLDSGYFRMDQLPERTAIGYTGNEQSWRSNIYSVPIKGGPDGGAFTTVLDLANFWDALFNNQLLSAEMTKLLLTPHAKDNDQTYYGYGIWMKMLDNEILKFYVMGSDPGVVMQSSVYAKSKIHAHIIGNIDKGAGMIARKIDEWVNKRL
jgi:Beta-lactamase class C and other penicillin binding proteins